MAKGFPFSYRAPDITGQTFGRLTVVERAPSPRHAHLWRCRCACGGEAIIRGYALYGRYPTRSCGCLTREATVTRTRKHGGYKRPEYLVWRGIIDRCVNPRSAPFAHYGGRGIVVCEQWRHDFAAFLAHMGQRPSPRHTVERIDNNGPYAPENCRWATMKEQGLNTRKSIVVEHEGERMSLLEFSKRAGVPWSTLYARVKKRHQDPAEAVKELLARG